MTSREQEPGEQPLRALVVASPPLASGGGVAAVCRAMVEALAGAGYDVTYFSTSERQSSESRAHPWLPTTHLGGLSEAHAARRVAGNGNYDLVVSNGTVGWGLCGDRSIHFYHGTYAGQAAAVRSQIRFAGYLKMRYLHGHLLEGRAGRNKRCLANSRRTAREVRDNYGLDPAVVWCPVDTDVFSPGERTVETIYAFGLDPERPTGLFVGPGRPMKGGPTAFEIMRESSEWMQWIILGDPATVPDDLRGSQCVVPQVDHRQMPELYRSVDVLLSTSLYEPFGLVIAEALSCGLPVVCTPSGAADLLMRHDPLKRWVIEDASSVPDFLRAIGSVLAARNDAREATAAARSMIKERLAPSRWAEVFLREGAAIETSP